MRVYPINNNKVFQYQYFSKNNIEKSNPFLERKALPDITNPAYLNISFKGQTEPVKEFELFFSEKDLLQRTSNEYFTEYRLLDAKSEAYQNLSKKDKIVLMHLIKASDEIDKVAKKLDSNQNIDFEKYLDKEIANGNKSAEMTKRLYEAQKGIFANEVSGKAIVLAKGLEQKPGKGLYPDDLSIEEFHDILKRMINAGKDEEVKKILNQRTIVVRNGEDLKAIDYTEAFKEEFANAAKSMEKAAQFTENQDFRDYLIMQAKALKQNKPLFDCDADKKWAELQNTTVDFTIGRECYDDKMTPTVNANPELKSLLAERGIIAYAKDNLGATVGIVDKEGTDYLLKIKEYLPILAKKMPYSDQYEQSIKNDAKQTMVDIDVAHVSGHNAAYRSSITLAFNLPNNDKLAVQTGGGHRTVYLKQMRNTKYSDGADVKLKALLNDDFHKYFSVQAVHRFTILHENLHSLGPKTGLEKLGIYKNIIEENKADMGSIVMLDELTQMGFYTKEQQKETITSWIFAYIYPGANFKTAHATRNIMQHNYLIKNGAITFDEQNRMVIHFEKVTEYARKMLDKIIKIQLSGDSQIAKEYIDTHAVYSKELQILGDKLSSVSKRLNSYVEAPLAKQLLRFAK